MKVMHTALNSLISHIGGLIRFDKTGLQSNLDRRQQDALYLV